MPKIAFVGAGSLGFTRRLLIDIMSYEDLAGSTISLIAPTSVATTGNR